MVNSNELDPDVRTHPFEHPKLDGRPLVLSPILNVWAEPKLIPASTNLYV